MVEVPQDLPCWFRRHPYLKTDELEQATVGGVEGERFDVAVGDLPAGHSAECGSGCVDLVRFSSGGRPLSLFEGYKLRLTVLEDVGRGRCWSAWGARSPRSTSTHPRRRRS
jgi:hypothetical protein